MCRDCVGCTPDCPDRYPGISVNTSMLVHCPVCGKLNSSTKSNCKKCGADLSAAKLNGFSVTCLFTGKTCLNPCSLSKIPNKNIKPAECPYS